MSSLAKRLEAVPFDWDGFLVRWARLFNLEGAPQMAGTKQGTQPGKVSVPKMKGGACSGPGRLQLSKKTGKGGK